LAANTQPCTLAYWHQPRWTANGTNASTYTPWWSVLYAAHVDVVLNGHVHTYARFAPLDTSGNNDPANGIREVIVGTGGESLVSAAPSASPAPLVNYRGFGYLRMVLHPTGYDAQFIAANGAVKDTFSGTCHGSSPPPAALQVSQTAPASVPADAATAYTVTVTNRAAPTRRASPSPTTCRRTRSQCRPRRRAGAAPARGRSRATWAPFRRAGRPRSR